MDNISNVKMVYGVFPDNNIKNQSIEKAQKAITKEDIDKIKNLIKDVKIEDKNTIESKSLPQGQTKSVLNFVEEEIKSIKPELLMVYGVFTPAKEAINKLLPKNIFPENNNLDKNLKPDVKLVYGVFPNDKELVEKNIF